MSTPYYVRDTDQSHGSPETIDMGGDMSASRQCVKDIYIGSRGSFNFVASWSAASDAAGSFVIQENGGSTEATWVTIPEMSLAAVVAAQPGAASDDGVLHIRNIQTTAPRIRVKYTRTSGGADVPMLVEIY